MRAPLPRSLRTATSSRPLRPRLLRTTRSSCRRLLPRSRCPIPTCSRRALSHPRAPRSSCDASRRCHQRRRAPAASRRPSIPTLRRLRRFRAHRPTSRCLLRPSSRLPQCTTAGRSLRCSEAASPHRHTTRPRSRPRRRRRSPRPMRSRSRATKSSPPFGPPRHSCRREHGVASTRPYMARCRRRLTEARCRRRPSTFTRPSPTSSLCSRAQCHSSRCRARPMPAQASRIARLASSSTEARGSSMLGEEAESAVRGVSTLRCHM